MDKKSLISIITINYNDKVGLNRTFESVFNQTFQDFDYIVIDGGSTDGSKELIKENSEQINYWVSEPDKGIYNAMNKGISSAKGDYLLFLNSGDHFQNENILKFAGENLGIEDLIYSDLEVIGPKNKFVKEYPKILDLIYLYTDTLPHPATFIKKTAFEKVGLYDENLKIVSDWKFFLLAICKNNLSYKKIPNTLFSTFYLDGISSQIDNVQKIKNEKEAVLNEYYPEYLKYLEKIHSLKNENKSLKNYKYKFDHITKYKIIRVLAKLRIIKIC